MAFTIINIQYLLFYTTVFSRFDVCRASHCGKIDQLIPLYSSLIDPHLPHRIKSKFTWQRNPIFDVRILIDIVISETIQLKNFLPFETDKRNEIVLKLTRAIFSNEACLTSKEFHMTDDIFSVFQCFGFGAKWKTFEERKEKRATENRLCADMSSCSRKKASSTTLENLNCDRIRVCVYMCE
jgi:hypothetical protein